MTDLIVAVGHTWESSLVSRLGEVPGVRVQRRCPDLADLLGAAAAGHGDVAVVGSDVRGLDRESVLTLARRGLTVVGATPEGDEAAERLLRQMGVATFVHPGLDPAEIGTRIEGSADDPLRRALDSDEAIPVPDDGAGPSDGLEEAEQEGRVLAVWGPTGSPGRTTLAVNVAAEIADLGTSVVLVDLDTYGASVAQALSVLDEAPGIAAAARSSELGRLDLPELARLAPEVSPGLRVISGIGSPSRWPEVREAAVEQILALARRLAAVVVLDLGFCIEDDEELSYDTAAPRRNAATLTALASADELLVVGAGDPVGLQRLVRAVQALASTPSPEPTVVVNRVRSTAVGPDPERRIREALDRFAGIDVTLHVPDDPQALDAAMLRGATLAECAPQSPARHALRQLAVTLIGAEAAPVATRGRRRARARAR